MAVYCLSDIHGRKRQWEKMLDKIAFTDDDTLYIIGDVVDRHDHGIAILKQIQQMKNAELLMGNHELMVLDAMADIKEWDSRKFTKDEWMSIWLNNGGYGTLLSLKMLEAEERQELFNWIKQLAFEKDIEVNGEKYRLVHGAPEGFGKEEGFTDYWHHVTWSRPDTEEIRLPDDTERHIVLGHTPSGYYGSHGRIHKGINWMDIDCGMNVLGCIRLDDMEEFYV